MTRLGGWRARSIISAPLHGQIGYLPQNDVLVYATGGLAWSQVEETHTVQDGQNPIHASSTESTTILDGRRRRR
jgi:hypothetical protein